MKPKQTITAERTSYPLGNASAYQVIRAQNTTAPSVGDYQSAAALEALIASGVTVNIVRRPKGR